MVTNQTAAAGLVRLGDSAITQTFSQFILLGGEWTKWETHFKMRIAYRVTGPTGVVLYAYPLPVVLLTYCSRGWIVAWAGALVFLVKKYQCACPG